MTALGIVAFVVAYLAVFVPGYLWLMRRHDRETDAMWAEHRASLAAIRRGEL